MIEYAAILNVSSGGSVSTADRLTRYFLEVRSELLQFFARRADRHRAEDLVQDVWLRLRERSDPESWLAPRAVIFTVASNLAVDASRRKARDRALVSTDPTLLPSLPMATDPAVETELVNRLERVALALAELPPLCRDAFLLNRLDGLTHAEIAVALGVSRKSVQRYVERAVLHMLRVSKE